MIDMPREILNASMKNIYTDDKNRIEAIKWLTTFYQKDVKLVLKLKDYT